MVKKERQEALPDRRHNQRLFVDERLIDQVEYVPIDTVQGYRQQARKHPKKQIKFIEASLREFGFVSPVIIDKDGNIIVGHARILAAKRAGFSEVPVIRLRHLSPAQVRAYRIADNRLAELASWDEDILAVELKDLIKIDYDVELTGFEMPEIDLVIEHALAPIGLGPADDMPSDDGVDLTQHGDMWDIDKHMVLCGDARDPEAYEALLQGMQAQMVMTDPPYNVRIDGNVSGLGSIKHGEFVMASGEMSDEEYEAFLSAFVRNLIQYSVEGSVHYLFIDWRHQHVLERVCRRYCMEQLNLCVWVKSNGGMGAFYRSRHELVLVFKNGGKTPHINNVQLGKFKRNRTNVWEYEGYNSVSAVKQAERALHPTVKPVALIADAIRDSSKQGGLILDPFLGSGSTVIACEQTGRICAGLELDPHYVDVIIRRWEAFTGNEAVHGATGMTFRQMSKIRNNGPLLLPPPTTNGET